jgi:CD109 antigen
MSVSSGAVGIEAGMVVLDIAVPTGFSPVDQSIRDMIDRQPPEQRKVKRYDVAGRKVILYIEDMAPGESLSFRFQARALYPVRAQAVTSSAYAYYKPALRGETLGGAMVVEE